MFNLDDVVVLNSGGPMMKVIGFSHNGRVWCEWKNSDGFVEEASFNPETIKLVKS